VARLPASSITSAVDIQKVDNFQNNSGLPVVLSSTAAAAAPPGGKNADANSGMAFCGAVL
jgi:hypothetical protein